MIKISKRSILLTKKENVMNKKVEEIIKEYSKPTPLGSYNGNSSMFDEPTQDVDDL